MMPEDRLPKGSFILKRLALCVVAAALAVPMLATSASAAPVQLDVVAEDYQFSGIPYRLTPRFYKFTFSNQGQHDHEVVVLRQNGEHGEPHFMKGMMRKFKVEK